MAYIVDVNNAADPVDARGAGQAAEEIRAIKGKLNFCTVDGAGHVTFGAGRNLTTFGLNNFQGNTTLGTGTGNSHVVNGSATVTNGLNVTGAIQSISGGESQVQTTRTGTGASSFYLYNNGTQQGIFDSVQGALLTADKAGNITLSAGTGARINALAIDNNRNFSRVIPGGSTFYPDFACRAWVNFQGSTTNGNQTVRASGNVSSVVRNTTGDYTVNFATALPDASYSVTGTSSVIGAEGDSSPVSAPYITTPTTSAIRLWVKSVGSGAQDKSYIHFQVFR